MKNYIFFLVFISISLNAEVIDEIFERNKSQQRIAGIKSFQPAFDSANEKDNHASFIYDKEKTFRVSLRQGTNTLIQLPNGEVIQDFLLGDTENFKFTPFVSKWKNRGEIRARRANMDTNLVITGASGHVYSFYLRSHEVESKTLPHFVVSIKDPRFPKIKEKEIETEDTDYLRKRTFEDFTKINRRYKVLQDDSVLKPLDIFDDGQWTYFRFGKEDNLDSVKYLPVIYKVSNKKDSLVNMMVKGGFIIVKTLSDKWTLRLGEEYACVRSF